MDLPRHLLTGEPYPLRALVAFGLNHRMWPDSEGLLKALDKLDFIVDVDRCLTDSAKYCRHGAARLHARWSAASCGCIPRRTSYSRSRLIEPLGRVRSDVDIICDLAAKLGMEDELLNPQGAAAGTFSDDGTPDFAAAHELALDWLLEPTGSDGLGTEEAPRGHAGRQGAASSTRSTRRRASPRRAARWSSPQACLAKYAEEPGITALPDLPGARTQPGVRARGGQGLSAHPRHGLLGCPCSSTRAPSGSRGPAACGRRPRPISTRWMRLAWA